MVCQKRPNNQRCQEKLRDSHSVFQLGIVFIITILTIIASPVWSGFACLENPCFHGICIDSLDINSTHPCYCENGWTGYSCQINWDDCLGGGGMEGGDFNPCKNNGICLDGIASFNCSCPENFAGALCEYDLSACDEVFPCLNNGTCTVDANSSNGTFMCICPPGFSGTNCELDISVCNSSESVCLNGGKCMDGIGNNFQCDCDGTGFTGAYCENFIKYCESQPCQNGAVCVNKINDFSCACPFGYSGKSCESKLKICKENPCKNGAFCLYEDEDEDKFTCYCVPDFHGEYCEDRYNECLPGPKCKNGGTCVDGVGDFSCSCPFGYFGKSCQCTATNMTHLECTNTTIILPSFSDIPWDQSATIKEPVITPTSIIPVSATPLVSPLSQSSSTFQPEETVVFTQIITTPPVGPSSEDNMSTGVVEGTVAPSDGIKPAESDIISSLISETLASLMPPVPSKTLDIIPSYSDTIYDPCPSISIDGSEGLLVSHTQSLQITTSFNKTYDEHELSPSISDDIYTLQSLLITPTIGLSEKFDQSDVLFSTVKFQSDSIPLTPVISETQVLPPDKDLVDSSKVTSGLKTPEDVLTMSFSELIASSISPPFISSKQIEITESIELGSDISTIDITTAILPSVRDSQTLSLLSPAPPMISPTETLPISSLPPNIQPPFSESTDILFITPIVSEEIIIASRRSEDIAIPPSLKSTKVSELDSHNFNPQSQTSVLLEESASFMPSVWGSSDGILISPTPTIEITSPSPSVIITNPTSEQPLSDPCLDYCQNNAKCNSTSIQPTCNCSFQFTGDRCQTRRERFIAASFTGDSYLGYKVPNESINQIDLTTTMATNAAEGILLYTAVGRVYALIFIQGGHVSLHFSCGAQSMHFVETRTRVDNGFNFTLQYKMEMVVHGLNQFHCVGQISVNESYIMRGEQIVGNKGYFDRPMQLIYLGGVETPDATKNDELTAIIPGFIGCIYSLTINNEQKDLYEDALDGQSVSECSTFGCIADPCQGLSTCVPSSSFPFWSCLCSQGYQGFRCQIRVCESNPCLNGGSCTISSEGNVNATQPYEGGTGLSLLTTICLCPLGFSGNVCQSLLNITKPSFRPVLGTDYAAFITYEPIPRFPDWAQLKLHFVTQNTSQIALIFYAGYNPEHLTQDGSEEISEASSNSELELFADETSKQSGVKKTTDFFAITFVRGHLILTWNLGSGTQRIFTPSKIDNRLNIHTLFAGRSGRQAWLKVDGMRNVTGKSPGPFHRLNVDSELFVGGYEAYQFDGLPYDLPLHKGFQGCIFDFGFRVKNRLYLPRALRGRNVKNCYEEDC